MPKNNLAVAYAVRKRAGGKKMAKGGMIPEEDKGREYFKPHEGPQSDDQNEDFHPENSPEHGVEDAVLLQQIYPHEKLAHGKLPQDKEPARSLSQRSVNPIRPEPRMAQVNLPESAENENFAQGGEVRASMSRRERALMAARGKPIRPSDGHAEVAAGAAMSSTESASKNGGPSGKTTRMPLTRDDVRSGPPRSLRSSKEEQAMLAEGGYASPDLDEEEQGAFYDRGGIVADHSGGNEISSPRAPKKNFKEGYGESPDYQEEEDGERFAMGGYAHGGKAIAKSIMSKMKGKNYAEGGPVDEMGLQDQENDPDQFLAHNMEEHSYDHIDALDEGDAAAEDMHDPRKRKGMISKIMANLHSRHFGK